MDTDEVKKMVWICVEEYWIDMNMDLRNLWNYLFRYERTMCMHAEWLSLVITFLTFWFQTLNMPFKYKELYRYKIRIFTKEIVTKMSWVF